MFHLPDATKQPSPRRPVIPICIVATLKRNRSPFI
jgi:hypothetical protein